MVKSKVCRLLETEVVLTWGSLFAIELISCSLQGVLIVGERGTGKTSLALAIAAEARVPLVEVKAQQLEARLWVGQGASNLRELFQTARDLVDLHIFVFLYLFVQVMENRSSRCSFF